MTLGPAPAYLAARLALLALRASIGRGTRLEPDRVLLAPAQAPVSVDSAASVLAAMPKPLVCRAEGRNRALVVTCRPLAEPDEGEREWYRLTRHDEAGRGGYMGYLIDEYGPGDHLVIAFGRDESLVVPRSVVDLWHRDYEIRNVSHSGDDVGNSLAADEPEYREARRQDARGILHFSSPDDSQGHVEMRTFSLAPSDNASLEERERWKLLAGEMEQFFQGRPMPRDVAAFIAECRKRC